VVKLLLEMQSNSTIRDRTKDQQFQHWWSQRERSESVIGLVSRGVTSQGSSDKADLAGTPRSAARSLEIMNQMHQTFVQQNHVRNME
jgi:hypothetical protein